jgi:hypothetical protein
MKTDESQAAPGNTVPAAGRWDDGEGLKIGSIRKVLQQPKLQLEDKGVKDGLQGPEIIQVAAMEQTLRQTRFTRRILSQMPFFEQAAGHRSAGQQQAVVMRKGAFSSSRFAVTAGPASSTGLPAGGARRQQYQPAPYDQDPLSPALLLAGGNPVGRRARRRTWEEPALGFPSGRSTDRGGEPLKLVKRQPGSAHSPAGRQEDAGMPTGRSEFNRPIPQPPAIDVNLLADKVFDVLERKIRIERERRGLR